MYPLEQAPAALCCVRERGVLGKIVLVTSRYSADTTATQVEKVSLPQIQNSC